MPQNTNKMLVNIRAIMRDGRVGAASKLVCRVISEKRIHILALIKFHLSFSTQLWPVGSG